MNKQYFLRFIPGRNGLKKVAGSYNPDTKFISESFTMFPDLLDPNGTAGTIGPQGPIGPPGVAVGGPVGIPDVTGTYTFYADLNAAISAATAGSTVEVFSDIVETGAVTVTLKNLVNINMNGHKYTLTNAGNVDLMVDGGVTVNVSILNGEFIKTGTSGRVLYISDPSTNIVTNCRYDGNTSGNATAVIRCESFEGGVFVTRSTNSTAFQVVSSGNCINITGIAKQSSGTIGISVENGATLRNSYGYGGIGLNVRIGSSVINCTGEGTADYGISLLNASATDSTGISVTGTGITGAIAELNNCIGRSDSNTGISVTGASGIYKCLGKSNTGVGFYIQNNRAVDCTGVSVGGIGLQGDAGSSLYNCMAITKSIIPATCDNAYNTSFIASGSGVGGVGVFSDGAQIFNCIFKLSDPLSYNLYSVIAAPLQIKYGNNTFTNTTVLTEPLNILQNQSGTIDGEGNIIIG